ncbi:MAG TPA: M20/M25/M40 family metallo-hydrolase [Gaiellaceae bacterium]|jgi:tripeptide aminopeptidase|nr:M20/M25/M40 family metallo-hydrolase [Gaiellaceae bacterium]
MSPSWAPDVVGLFTELAAIPSPPGSEREVADRVAAYLQDLGLEVSEDDAGARIGANTGNLLARLAPSSTNGGTPIFLCAHLDTVQPTGPLEPVVEDGIIRNAGGTILGADNKSAVAAMLEAVRLILSENRPHAGIELLFTPKEEVGLQGAKAFDSDRLVAGVGFVFDHAAPIGEVMLGAPHARALEVTMRGRAAHAGMAPEEGRSAIAAAARAITDFRLGRLDDETTASVGLIQGGTAKNIVPDRCSFSIDVRSHDERKLADLVQEMLETITFAAALEQCEAETTVEESYRGYRFARGDLPVRMACAALEREGFEPRLALGGGGADANIFNERGRPCANLANGMTAIHTPDEHIAVADLERMVDVTLALVDVARALSPGD